MEAAVESTLGLSEVAPEQIVDHLSERLGSNKPLLDLVAPMGQLSR
jgi:hypothetical protein